MPYRYPPEFRRKVAHRLALRENTHTYRVSGWGRV